MPEYFALFNAITDCIRTLEQLCDFLKVAQALAEEAYITSSQPYTPGSQVLPFTVDS